MRQKVIISVGNIVKVKTWSYSAVSVFALTLCAVDTELASIVDGWNAVHSVHHSIAALCMIGIFQH